MEETQYRLHEALDDFRKEQRKAIIQDLLSRLKGESDRLLSFDDVRQKLKGVSMGKKELKEIPLEAIIGSVNRYDDFTRDFLPLSGISPERWAKVETVVMTMEGLPPIEVYQIGEAYFVSDGNHRVSVARKMGNRKIDAYVTEVKTRVPLMPGDRPEDLILKSELANFLEQTRMDYLRPHADLSVTVPGAYTTLLEFISVHRYYLGLEHKREIPFDEAVTHWFDDVYMPVVEVIRSKGLARDFPGKTETDLYIWLSVHRSTLEQKYGEVISISAAATHLANQFSSRLEKVRTRTSHRFYRWLLPEAFEPGPPVGKWRQEKEAYCRQDCLFSDILVIIDGKEDGWNVLEQALVIALKEDARLHGLHVVTPLTRKDQKAALSIQERFAQRCIQAGVKGKLVLSAGDITRNITERAAWNDLVITRLSYPSRPQYPVRLDPELRTMIQSSPRPVLVAGKRISDFNSALLAYDGSPKANEALYVATYLAGRWNIRLVVLINLDGNRVTTNTTRQAQEYLEKHSIQASYIQETGEITASILLAAEEHDCDLLIMGGYGYVPISNLLLGSAAGKVLSHSRRPILLCR